MSIEPGIYTHYKGNQYEVLGVARQSETLEEVVVYRALYTSADFGDRALWVRPVTMFSESITLPDGETMPRFRKM